MKKAGGSRKRKVSSGCHASRAIQTVQPFPDTGLLADNLNQRLSQLRRRIGRTRDRAYSYVLTTVKLGEGNRLEQHGSAPNFQGDVITLCTCKHQMRASQSAADWEAHVWIVGFTSRCIYEGKHWLFYLTKVDQAFESQSELWNGVPGKVRQAKAARKHFLGDMFEPKRRGLTGDARYSPSRYYTPPIHAHRQHPGGKGWHNDISYKYAQKYGHPALLVGDPDLTFLWQEPMIFFKDNHCRNYRKWLSLQSLIVQLQEAH